MVALSLWVGFGGVLQLCVSLFGVRGVVVGWGMYFSGDGLGRGLVGRCGLWWPGVV